MTIALSRTVARLLAAFQMTLKEAGGTNYIRVINCRIEGLAFDIRQFCLGFWKGIARF